MIRLRRAVSDTDPTTDLLKNTRDAVGVTCGHTNAPTENPGEGQQSGRLRRVLRGPTRRYQKERLRPSGVTSLVSQVYHCPILVARQLHDLCLAAGLAGDRSHSRRVSERPLQAMIIDLQPSGLLACLSAPTGLAAQPLPSRPSRGPFASGERLDNVNAATAEQSTTCPSLRKAFARHSLGMPTRIPERSGSGHCPRPPAAGRPVAPALDPVFVALDPGALTARERPVSRCTSGSAVTRSTPPWGPMWWSS
jgi:hypothetical protein